MVIHSYTVNVSVKARRNLRRPQRAAALRIIRAYRTVSDKAAFLLVGMSPVNLIVADRDMIKVRASQDLLSGNLPLTKSRIREEDRQIAMNELHRRCIRSKKAPLTYRLISNLTKWENRTVPRVPWKYHMIQALIEYECFQYYLHRMGRDASPSCMHCYCGSDTTERTFSADSRTGAASGSSSANAWVTIL